MRRTLTGVCLGMACLLAAGCSGIRGYPKDFNNYNENFLNQLNEKIFKGTSSCPAGSACARYFECTDPAYNGDKERCRNEIVGELMLFVDLQYNDFRASLHAENTVGRLVTDAVPIGVSAAGVLATTWAAKNTLAAIATGTSGLRASYEKSVLFDSLMPALISAMDANRAKQKDKIISGLSQECSVYPIPQAVSDVNEYFLAGTLPEAINKLTTEKTEKALSAEKLLLADKVLSLQESASRKSAETKKKILKDIAGSVVRLQPEQAALLEVQYKYKVGASDDINKDADLSGALVYVLSRIADSETYTRADTAVNTSTTAKP